MSDDRLSELRAKLSGEALALLDSEDGRYSEWATASALAMYAMNAGLDEDDFVRLVVASDFAEVFASENGRDRSGRLEGRLRKVWERAEKDWNPPLGGSAADVRVRLGKLSERLDGPWYGRTASSNRAVALALVAKAHEIGVWTVDISERELSVRAGVARTTAGNALRRLADLGVISKDETRERESDQAQRWIINLDWSQPDMSDSARRGISGDIGPYKPLPPSDNSYGLVMPINHPVFLRSALGPTAEWVCSDLISHPDSKATDIANRLGVSRDAVTRTLEKKLVPNQVVVKTVSVAAGRGRPSAVYRIDPDLDSDRLDRIAAEYGVSDWEARTTQRYDGHRAAFAVLREKWSRSSTGVAEDVVRSAVGDDICSTDVVDGGDRWHEEQEMLRQHGLPNELG